jgi:nucleoside-diphosphate-sugar epimerase
VATNIGGTLAVLEAARDAGVRRVVHTSTSETYGSAQYIPIDEKHPTVGQSPYAATKIAADKLAESYFLSFGLPVVTLRPFNTYGPRQSLRAVIPSMMVQALFSEEIVVGALEPVRDMNYVDDTVRGFLGVAAAPGVEGEAFNIGSGVGHTIGEILACVREVTGADKPVRQAPERIRPPASEVTELVCDFSKAAATFGYAPAWTLRAGVERLRDYVAAHPPAHSPALYRV